MDVPAPTVARAGSPDRTPWPLNPLDAALVAQTYAGRPMTTHHVLECDALVDPARLRAATVTLVRMYPELASRVELGPWPRRYLRAPHARELADAVVVDDDDSFAATERWIQLPIRVDEGLPFAIRLSPARRTANAITLSLHHSIADGHGAMAVFDRLLDLTATGYARPRLSPTALPPAAPLRLADAMRGIANLWRPAAQVWDDHASPDVDAAGHGLTLARLGLKDWRAFGAAARARSVSRNTLSWLAAAQALGTLRRESDHAPIRILGPVDLRAALGVPDGALQNWLGTLEVDVDPTAAPEDVHDALRRARQLPQAASTTAMVGAVGSLPAGLARAIFRGVDSQRWRSSHSLLLSMLRPDGTCWPAAMRPRRMWCCSLLPRKPAVGITVTASHDVVTLAATWRADIVDRDTARRFLDAVVARIRAFASDAASAQPWSIPASAQSRG